MSVPHKYYAVKTTDWNASPALCDLTYPGHSRIVVASQYYAWLLLSHGDARWLLLFREDLHWVTWKKTSKAQAATLRRVLLVAATWLARRFGKYKQFLLVAASILVR